MLPNPNPKSSLTSQWEYFTTLLTLSISSSANLKIQRKKETSQSCVQYLSSVGTKGDGPEREEK
jgi:hypothetical protein